MDDIHAEKNGFTAADKPSDEKNDQKTITGSTTPPPPLWEIMSM